MVVIAATGSGSLIASNMFTGSVRRPGSFLSSISSYLNGIGRSPLPEREVSSLFPLFQGGPQARPKNYEWISDWGL